MNIRNLFFLGSILLLLSCKNSKQQEGYNSINIIKYIVNTFINIILYSFL